MNGYGSSTSNPSGVQGACPNGWHVPSDNEWKQMEMFLGMTQAQADGSGWRGTDQGGKLKSTNLWTSPNTGATNSSGFTALPAGARENYGSFSGLGTQTYWWTTSETSSSDARYRGLLNSNIQVYRSASTKDKGQSIRCLR